MTSTVTLIPVNRSDGLLMEMMTRRTSPRWMRLAACLALESRRVVLVKDGLRIADICPRCSSPDALVRAFHKNALRGDPRCLVTCEQCGHAVESRPLISLERNQPDLLKGFREAF